MKINKSLFLLFLIFSFQNLKAQSYALEALKYSRTFNIGTARSYSMASAFGALGADLSNLHSNPAGIGVFRKNKITFTPAFTVPVRKAKINGFVYTDEKFNLNISNLGLVFTKRFNKKRTKGVQFLNFTLNYNRMNSFHHDISFRSNTDAFSLGSYFAGLSQGITPENLDIFGAQLAYNTFLTDTSGTNTNYVSNGIPVGTNREIKRNNNTRGSVGEFALGTAINISNRIYIGVGFTLSRISYETEEIFEVDNSNTLMSPLMMVEYKNLVDVSGIGFNAKVGIIGRVTDWLRLGLAFHTPTWYGIDEEYYSEMQTELNFGAYNATSPQGDFSYNIATPWRIQGSAGFIIKETAAIGLEYEYTDYRNISLNDTTPLFATENDFTENFLKISHKIKIGGEYKFNVISLRAGYAFVTNPFTSQVGIDASKHIATAGFGAIFGKRFTLNFAYGLVFSEGREILIPYFNNSQFVQISGYTSNILISLVFTY